MEHLSVFRGVQKLEGASNYKQWSFEVRTYMKALQVWSAVDPTQAQKSGDEDAPEQMIPQQDGQPPSTDTSAPSLSSSSSPARTPSAHPPSPVDLHTLAYIVACVSPSHFIYIELAQTGRQAWRILRDLYAPVDSIAMGLRRRQFWRMTQEPGESLAHWGARFRTAAAEEPHGASEGELVYLLLEGMHGHDELAARLIPLLKDTEGSTGKTTSLERTVEILVMNEQREMGGKQVYACSPAGGSHSGGRQGKARRR